MLNTISKTKAIWRILGNSNLFSKWCLEQYNSLWMKPAGKCSALWKELQLFARKFKSRFYFSPLNSPHLSLFYDPWCNGLSIFEMLGSCCFSIFNAPQIAKISIINHEGNWVLPDSLCLQFPNCYNQIVKASTAECEQSMWDIRKPPSSSSIISAFFSHLPEVTWWHCVWFKSYAINYATYCWMAIQRGLKTSDLLISRGLNLNNRCCLCKSLPESHNHLFFECEFSRRLLQLVLPCDNLILFDATLLQLLSNYPTSMHHASRRIYFLVIAVSVYVLWKERNCRLYGGVDSQPNLLARWVTSRVGHKISNWNWHPSWPSEVREQFSIVSEGIG